VKTKAEEVRVAKTKKLKKKEENRDKEDSRRIENLG